LKFSFWLLTVKKMITNQASLKRVELITADSPKHDQSTQIKELLADLKKQEIEIADQEELISALLEMDIDEDMNICQYQVDQSKSVSVSRGAHGYKMEINEY